ncbi:MAG: hypothetical protein WC091_23850 [Sulfuricellaceae bacterium]
MSINSVSSNSLATTALDIRPAVTGQNEVRNVGREKEGDNDKDDKSIAPQASAGAKPSVNASGQVIGTTISTKA